MGKATAYPASGRSSQSRRRIRTLLGKVTIVVVACACAAPPDGTPTPTQASTLRTVSALAASPAGLPSTPLPPTATRNPVVAATPTATRIERREAIPWTRVGPGWSVVTWTPENLSGVETPNAATLLVVSPVGVRYAAGPLPAGFGLADVSVDGHRVLLRAHLADRLIDWDLVTGHAREVGLPDVTSLDDVRYLPPTGAALLISAGLNDAWHLERRTVAGSLVTAYPRLPGQSPAGGPLVASPDGQLVAVPMRTGELALVESTAGSLVRVLPRPPEMQMCGAVRWSDADHLMASCSNATSSAWRYHRGGGNPDAVATAVGPDGLGYVDAWPVTDGVLVKREVACGGEGVVGRRTSDGSDDPVRVVVPGVGAERWTAAAVVGDTAYLLPMGCQEPRWPRTLVAYDTTADVATVLVGGLGGGTLLTARILTR